MSSDRELRKGSAETLILALLEERDRHGYEILLTAIDPTARSPSTSPRSTPRSTASNAAA
jgi:hypothetical protein